MDWLNIHRTTLGSEQFLGSDPVQRATWLCLMAYCADQENGGRIVAADAWNDRRWQQIVRVTHSEVCETCALWSWDGADLVVWAYPAEKEAEVRRNRENGKGGGRPPKKPAENHPVIPGLSETEPPAPISAETERNRKGIGKEEEGERKENRERVAGSAEIVVQAWNASVEGTNLPKARETTPRRRTIATRLKEKGWIEDFRIAAAFVASSPFHCGDNDRKWTATIDYLLQAGKATELAEKQKAIAPARQFEISAPPLTEADLEAARRL